MAESRAESSKTLARLALLELCRSWHSSRSLSRLPLELSRLVWEQLKANHALEHQAAAGDHDAPAAPMPCALMFPLVRDVWRASEMDLSDGGRWITDASLGALAYLDGLASLRLTLCRFLTDSGFAQLPRLSGLQALDISWTELGDRAAGHLAGCPGLTSLNLTGLGGLTDRGVASLLPLRRLQRLSLASTSVTDAALDYLTYYTRFPEANTDGARGVSDLRWLELSNTRITDTGVGKLVAIIEDGSPYGRVFKQLEYLALSMTPGVGPPAVRQVRQRPAVPAHNVTPDWSICVKRV
mmetsp:Transcript_4457/g.14449  ORF Transcript_4457/g.14449 Transcript_4457/m.14449 type:complete len:297 (-) Transcript_4457:424-1314(-)